MQEGLHENAGLLCPQRDRQVSGCSGHKRVKVLFSSFALHLLLYGNVLPYVVHFILRFPQFGIRLFEGGAYMGAGGALRACSTPAGHLPRRVPAVLPPERAPPYSGKPYHESYRIHRIPSVSNAVIP